MNNILTFPNNTPSGYDKLFHEIRMKAADLGINPHRTEQVIEGMKPFFAQLESGIDLTFPDNVPPLSDAQIAALTTILKEFGNRLCVEHANAQLAAVSGHRL